jgi:hypothetical protein
MATLTRIQGYIYDATGTVRTVGELHITAQQDFISVDGTKVAPFTKTVDLSASAGLVDVFLYATVGATPSGLAYFVEFDPDPDDLTKPMRNKNGYWNNYWSVADTVVTVPIGNFTTALRGSASQNYMPTHGTVNTDADAFFVGPAQANTTKRIIANQIDATPPEIRFNAGTSKWEFSHDGATFTAFAPEGTLVTTADTTLLGVSGNTTKKLQANQNVANKPEIRYNHTNGRWEFSHDGVAFYPFVSTVGQQALLQFPFATELTISSDTITPTQNQHRVDTQADAASDDLVTISSAGIGFGHVLVLQAENAARVVTIKRTGNIKLKSTNFVLDDTDKRIGFVWDGSNWIEWFRNAPIEETVKTLTAAASLDIDLTISNAFEVSLTTSISTGLTVSNELPSGDVNQFTLIVSYPDNTARTINFATMGTVKWSHGAAPTLTCANGKKDVFTFLSTDNGSTWLAFISGQNF